MSDSNKKNDPDVVINFPDDDIGFGNIDSLEDYKEPSPNESIKNTSRKAQNNTETAKKAQKDVNTTEQALNTELNDNLNQKNGNEIPVTNEEKKIESDIDKTVNLDISSISTETDDADYDGKKMSPVGGKKKGLLIVIALILIAVLLIIIMFLLKSMKESEKHETSNATPVATETTELSLHLLQSEIAYDPTALPIDATTLVQPEKDGDSITADPETIDPAKIGTQTVTYTITRNGQISTVAETFTVSDKNAPIIKIKETSVTVRIGDEFDPASNVESVTDDIDGNLERKESIDPNTAGYTLSSNVDTSKAGTYQVSVNAVDSTGNSSNQIYTVYVSEQAKKAAQSQISSNNSSNNNQNVQNRQNNSSNQNSQSNENKSASNSAQKREAESNIDEKADKAEGRSINDLIKQNQQSSEETTKNSN